MLSLGHTYIKIKIKKLFFFIWNSNDLGIFCFHLATLKERGQEFWGKSMDPRRDYYRIFALMLLLCILLFKSFKQASRPFFLLKPRHIIKSTILTISQCTVQWHYIHPPRRATIRNIQNSVIVPNQHVKGNQSRTVFEVVKTDFSGLGNRRKERSLETRGQFQIQQTSGDCWTNSRVGDGVEGNLLKRDG